MADFTTPDPKLAPGSTHEGFTVVGIEPLAELSGTGYIFRHDASGARLLWIACPDQNRAFSIAFKTPPQDDTGVFHILEHSVLCGSDRFPVKEPFVNLIRTSMQTFLNALTFPDKTMYPVASTNVKDFENLMDVYLDAVLHPAIYHRPRIFEQEGWHYELESLDAPLTYNGVVFNEMKGALSDPDDVLYQALGRQLFPDTAYACESGGNPRAIPTLTYEQFLDTHARHYNLPNSYTVLYGDLDIERELAFIAKRFAGATQRVGTHEGALTEAGPNPLELQAPLKAAAHRVEMATAPENACIGIGYVVGTAHDRERMLAIDILLDAISGSNEAPLKRAILDADLGSDFQVSLLDSMLQPHVLFQLKGAHEGVAEQFRTLVEDSCRKLATEGIGHDRLEAALAQAEFNLREADFGGRADGVVYAMQVMASWLYDDNDPVSYLRYEEELAHMKAGLDAGYFEQLLKEIVPECAHSALVELVPVEEGDAAEELAELASIKDGMSEEELQAVMDEVAALREEQERPDAPEDLAKLPQLALSDIGDAPDEVPARRVEAPLACIHHDLDTHHICYVSHYFDLRRLSFEELGYVTILCSLLGKLDTEEHSASELDTLIEGQLGSLGFYVETYGRDGDPDFVRPVLVVGGSALSEKVTSLATIPSEVWGHTRFDDIERIHDVLVQRRVAMEQTYVGSGHAAAIARLASYFLKTSTVVDAFSGVGNYLFLKDLLAHWDERAQDIPELLSSLARRIFTADEVTVSFTGSKEDLDAFWAAGGTLGLPTAGEQGAAHQLVVPTPTVKNEAFVIPADVCFVAEGMPPLATDPHVIGTWKVASRALSYDYLWNEVRVKGGAYGCGYRYTNNGVHLFWSYRDPAVDPSVARFGETGAWLADWQPTEDELDGYIVSVVASEDAPLKPQRLASKQDTLYFTGRPADWHRQIRAQELATTAEALRELAPVLTELENRRALCVFGGRDKVEASKLGLTVIELIGA